MAFDTAAHTPVAAACEVGFTFEPTWPSGQGIGAKITVRGPESAAARAHTRRQLARHQSLELAAKKQGRPTDLLSLALGQDENESLRQRADAAVAFTIGWAGFLRDGAPIECNEAETRRLYTDYPFIADQVIQQAQELGNFVKPSSQPCSITPAPSGALI
jgi:hypothetical protein